jgi:hypothetical protein
MATHPVGCSTRTCIYVSGRPAITKPEAEDDDEVGLLELSEDFEEQFGDASDVIVRIVKATEMINKKIQAHGNRVACPHFMVQAL